MKKVISIEDKYIRWFSDLKNSDVAIAGGKGASLGEMYSAKFPVPPGFVITAQSFKYFMEVTGLKNKIADMILGIDLENTEELQNKSKEIRELIVSKEMPSDLKEEILEAYKILSSEKVDSNVPQNALNILRFSHEPIFVSVRSSATTEDLAEASFAGQQESYLNVKGDSSLITHVKMCFASLYTARAIYYRNKKGFNEGQSLLAAVVQKMVNSEKSGVVFSRNPVTFNDDVVLESVFGLGEGIVSGMIKPDHFVISRDLEIKEVKIVDKKIAIIRTGSGQNETVRLSSEKSREQTLTNREVLEVANYAIRLEDHYKKPQDIEFALEDGKVYILQSRPITTLNIDRKDKIKTDGKILLHGLGASPGIGVGTVKIVNTMEDLQKIKKGDVLVTKMTNPDMVVSMQKSVAIVTDEGGITSHASIVSREMGIPAVVGTDRATQILTDGMKVTVDGREGNVYEGEVAETSTVEIKPALETKKIKLKLIMDLPDFAERAAKTGIKYVGLQRLEGIIATSGKHPLAYEQEKDFEGYQLLLQKGIDRIAERFDNIWIRSSDIRSDEFSTLKGAPEKELNPMLGFHGIRFSLKHPQLFEAELKAIEEVAKKYPHKTFGVMFPQIISAEEVKQAKLHYDKFKKKNMQFGIMVETPAAVQVIEDMCHEGIEFVSFGTNDLTQFTMAIDRGNEDVQYLYDELNPAILLQLKRVINVCKKYGVQTSICGQAGSRKEMAEYLFKQGIDSISVNADAAYDVSVLIRELEGQLILPESEEKEEIKETVIAEQKSNEKKKFGFDVVCDKCGVQTRVPFKPKPGRPVFCKECFQAKKTEVKSVENIEELPQPNIIVAPPKIQEYQKNEIVLKKEEKEIEHSRKKIWEIENQNDINPIDDEKDLEKKSELIAEQIRKENERKIQEMREREAKIEAELEELKSIDENLGVYSPELEDDEED